MDSVCALSLFPPKKTMLQFWFIPLLDAQAVYILTQLTDTLCAIAYQIQLNTFQFEHHPIQTTLASDIVLV